MTTQGREVTLRKLRKDLVMAAEGALDVNGARLPRYPEKSQMSKLVSAANEASCVEEIENYLRYQVARHNVWDAGLAQRVIEGAEKIVGRLEDDQLRVEAWRLYATYLMRAHRYQKAVEEREGKKSRGHPKKQRDESRGRQSRIKDRSPGRGS